jgi:hypothetical protein
MKRLAPDSSPEARNTTTYRSAKKRRQETDWGEPRPNCITTPTPPANLWIPDDIIHKIISFLPDPMLAVVQFVSRSCHQFVKEVLWPSRVNYGPVIQINRSYFDYPEFDPPKVVKREAFDIHRGSHNVFDWALSENNQSLVNWLYSVGCPVSPKAFSHVKSVKAFRWLRSIIDPVYFPADTLISVAKTGNLRILKLMVMSPNGELRITLTNFSHRLLEVSAFYGHLDTVKWLVSLSSVNNSPKHDEIQRYFDAEMVPALWSATANNKLNVVKWFFKDYKFTKPKSEMAQRCLDFAVEMNSKEVIRWIHKHRQTLFDESYNSFSNGDGSSELRRSIPLQLQANFNYIAFRGTIDDLSYIKTTYNIQCTHKIELSSALPYIDQVTLSDVSDYVLSLPVLEEVISQTKGERSTSDGSNPELAWDKESMDILFFTACSYNRVDVLNYMKENDPIFIDELKFYKLDPKTQKLKKFNENNDDSDDDSDEDGSPFRRAIHGALANGHIAPIKWCVELILELNPGCTKVILGNKIIIAAVKIGISVVDLEWFVKYVVADLHRLTLHGLLLKILYQNAAIKGHLHIVEWCIRKHHTDTLPLSFLSDRFTLTSRDKDLDLDLDLDLGKKEDRLEYGPGDVYGALAKGTKYNTSIREFILTKLKQEVEYNSLSQGEGNSNDEQTNTINVICWRILEESGKCGDLIMVKQMIKFMRDLKNNYPPPDYHKKLMTTMTHAALKQRVNVLRWLSERFNYENWNEFKMTIIKMALCCYKLPMHGDLRILQLIDNSLNNYSGCASPLNERGGLMDEFRKIMFGYSPVVSSNKQFEQIISINAIKLLFRPYEKIEIVPLLGMVFYVMSNHLHYESIVSYLSQKYILRNTRMMIRPKPRQKKKGTKMI